MAGFFDRISKVFQAEANTAVARFEDPIKLTEQGIRDLKGNLTEAMTSLAQVKGVAIRLKKDAEDEKRRSAEYERKAMTLLQRMQSGGLEQGEAERLAAEALRLKAEADTRATALSQDFAEQDRLAGQLQTKVDQLRRDISRYDNELVTLRARAKTATSVKKINQHLAGADSSDTISMLERMRQKVEEEESLAQAYGELNTAPKSADAEIDRALAAPAADAQDSLADLKKRMGITG
jgi:phage shock protein A